MDTGCLGVVAAMPQEIAPLLSRVKQYRKERLARFNLYRFELQGARVVLVESGMGPRHARAATEALISLAKPDLLLNFGLAGAVLPGVEAGELILAERVLWLEAGRLSEAPHPDPQLRKAVDAGCAAASIPLRRGTFITAAAIMNKERVAASLEAGISVPVLEMETAAVLQAALEAGVPAVAVRGVSDPAHEELGFSLEEFCDGELRVSLLRVAGCVIRKPWIVPQLLRLGVNSRKAAENLAVCVEVALGALGKVKK